MTAMWKQGREPLRGFHILRLGLDPERKALYQRINQRAQQMFADGLVDETARLQHKYGDRAWALSSLGYRQAGQLLSGELSREAALSAAQQGHRNYAKRQMTWFRREPDVRWLPGCGDDPAILAQAAALIESHLRSGKARI
jgi:tRNA dimethylallyltransferase